MGKPTRAKRRVEPSRTEPRQPRPPKVEPSQALPRLRPSSRPWLPVRLGGCSPLRWLRRRRFMRWLRRQPLVRRLRRRMPPRRVRSVLAGAAIAAAAFAIGAYVIAPYLIQRAVERYGESAPERSASAARVRVDPFSLTVTLVRPAFVDSSLGASFGADEVRVNFGFSALFGRSVALDELSARAPTLRLDLEKMESLRSEPIFGGTPVPSAAGDSFAERVASVLGIRGAVRIGHLHVESGRLELVAANAEKSSTFDGIRIDAQRLAADRSAADRSAADRSATVRYSVSSDAVTVGSAAEAAALNLDGTLSLAFAQLHTEGRAKLSGLALGALRPWLAPRLAAASPAGQLALDMDYEYPIASKWRLSNGEARITDAYAEVVPGLSARAARAQLHLTAASGGEALEAAAFDVRAEQVAVEEPGDGGPRRLASADSAEVSDVRLSGAKPNGSGPRATGDDRDFPWLVTIGTGRLAGVAAAVEIADASADPDSDSDPDFDPDADSDSDPDPDPDADFDSDSGPDSDLGGHTDASAGTDLDGDLALLPGRALFASLARPAFSTAEASADRPFVLHRLELAGARVAFVDRAATPAARFATTDLAGSIAASAAEPGSDVIEISLSGGFADGGSGSFDAVLERVEALPPRTGAAQSPAAPPDAGIRPSRTTADVPAPPSARVVEPVPPVLAKDALLVPRSLALALSDVPASTLSPYAQRVLGRALGGGRVDLVFDCTADDGHLDGKLRIAGDQLVLADEGRSRADSSSSSSSTSTSTSSSSSFSRVPPAPPQPRLSPPSPSPSSPEPSPSSPEPSPLPVDLAVALLADSSGRVELTSALAMAAACVPAVAAETLRFKLAAVAAAPFETLADVIGREASSLNAVSFEPGTAEPSETGVDALDALAEALERRPKVGLRVADAYDPNVDRGALAEQEVELHVALETAGATLRVTPGPVDFTLPLAQKVLDEFAARQLTAEQRATIASEFDLHAGGAADAATRLAYYREIFDALVRSQSIQPGALARLGRFRAESIARQLEKRGIDRERVAWAADAGNETDDAGERGSARAENGGVAVPLEAVALPFEDASP